MLAPALRKQPDGKEKLLRKTAMDDNVDVETEAKFRDLPPLYS
jgi:hypothetical protein